MELLTRPEAAAALRVSLRTLDTYVKDGRIKAMKIGPKLVRIPQSEIDRALAGSDAE